MSCVRMGSGGGKGGLARENSIVSVEGWWQSFELTNDKLIMTMWEIA